MLGLGCSGSSFGFGLRLQQAGSRVYHSYHVPLISGWVKAFNCCHFGTEDSLTQNNAGAPMNDMQARKPAKLNMLSRSRHTTM